MLGEEAFGWLFSLGCERLDANDERRNVCVAPFIRALDLQQEPISP